MSTSKAAMTKLKVRLNGIGENPFAMYGLTQNPFPQIARAELAGPMRQLNKLGAAPIPHDRAEAHIREVLRGWSEEFVSGCISRFVPGEMVEFDVSFPDE